MEPEKTYDIQEVNTVHLPKRHSKGYWYGNNDSTIRNYIIGQDNASFSGIGLRSLERARNDYMSLGDTFRRKSLSAPEMAKLDNEYGIDQSLFDIARNQVESNYQNAEENYNSGKISDRKWNRLSKKYDRELSNLNENQKTLDQHQNPLKYVSGNGDITPLFLSLGIPAAIIGAVATAPHLWSALNHPIVQGIGAIDGIRNLFTGNGVQKTINHFKDEEYGKGMLSLAGDVLDASPLLGLPKAIKTTKSGIESGLNAIDLIRLNYPIKKSTKLAADSFASDLTNPKTIPIYHYGNDFRDSNGQFTLPRMYSGGDAGLHVSNTPLHVIYQENPKRILHTGLLTIYPDRIADVPDISHWHRIWMKNNPALPFKIRKNIDKIKNWGPEEYYDIYGEHYRMPDIGFDNNAVHMNYFNNNLLNNSILNAGYDVLSYDNKWELGSKLFDVNGNEIPLKSYAVFNPNSIVFSKTIPYESFDNGLKDVKKELSLPKLQTDLQFWKEYTKLKKSDEILKHRLSNDDNLNKLYKELGENFKDPYLKQMIGKNPQYYAPMKYYMDVMGLDEISAWKQLITDRNTMYRTTAYAGNNADEVATNVKNNLHKYTFEITANPNNKYNPSVVDFVRTEPNIGILYSGEGARAYMSPLWVLRRTRGQGQNTDAVFKYGDLPTNVTGVTTKSSPKLDFSGSHHEWYKRNLTLPKSSQSINGDFSYNGRQGAIWIPSELFNRYNLKNHGAKFVSYDPEKWNNYVHDEISPFMTEVVFQGPIGYRLPFKINEYDKTNLVKRFLPHISKDKEIPYYHSVGDLYHIFEPASSIRIPLIPYGYSQGGKIINIKEQ